MAVNPVREKRDLLYIFGLQNPSSLLIRVAISGEVQVVAEGSLPNERVTVLLQPSDNFGFTRSYNLLDFAPITWWRTSSTLMRAVESGWLYVDIPDGPGPSAPAALENPDCCDLAILKPPSPQVGDLLMWDGTSWTKLSPGTAGWVLTSNGVSVPPTYQAVTIPPVTNTTIFVPMALDQSTDNAGFEMVGGFSLDASDYTDIRFVTLGAVTNVLLVGEINLYNLTDSATVITHTFTSTNPTSITSAALSLPSGPKVYEVRIRVTGGTPPADRVICTWAGLKLKE